MILLCALVFQLLYISKKWLTVTENARKQFCLNLQQAHRNHVYLFLYADVAEIHQCLLKSSLISLTAAWFFFSVHAVDYSARITESSIADRHRANGYSGHWSKALIIKVLIAHF